MGLYKVTVNTLFFSLLAVAAFGQAETITAHGDAPLSYGFASNMVSQALVLGQWSEAKVQRQPLTSLLANTAANDDALSLVTTADGYTDLLLSDLRVDAAGRLHVKVKVTNTSAKTSVVKAWLDWNRNNMFDADEGSIAQNVLSGSIGTVVDLQWSAYAPDVLRNGVTYLRVRASTVVPEVQAVGSASDGDVEDYRVNLNVLEFANLVTVNAATPVVGVSDTMTYTLRLKNKLPAAMLGVNVFVPMHNNVVMLSGTVPAGGTLGTVTQNGQTVPVVQWPSRVLAAGEVISLTFKVAVKDVPKTATSIISTVGFARYGNLSVTESTPSTGNSCGLAVVTVDSKKYKLLDLKLTATTNTPSGKVAILDTITYALRLKNKLLVNQVVQLINPLPQHTRYVVGSASIGGVLGAVVVKGTAVQAVQWPLLTLRPAADTVFFFKVAVSRSVAVSGASAIENKALATFGARFADTTYSSVVLVDVDVERVRQGAFRLTKSVSVKSSNGKVGLLDTITYSLKLTNNLRAKLSAQLVFDPIPIYTMYVRAGTTTGGVLGTISLHGMRLPAVAWPGMELAPGKDTTLSFKVVVVDIPKNVSRTVSNEGFAVYELEGHVDTISSIRWSGLTLNEVAPMFAKPDYASSWRGASVQGLNIAANDVDPLRLLVATSIVAPPTQGHASFNANGTLNYTPLPGFAGLDSLTYGIKTLFNSVEAKAYFSVLSPSSQTYQACPGAKGRISMKPQAGVSFYWYTAPLGGVASPSTPANSKDVLKNSEPLQSWWVEPVWNGIVFPRGRLDLLMAGSCGKTVPVGCALDGTVVWRENFDQLSEGLYPFSANFALEGLPAGHTDLSYFAGPSGMPEGGYYSLVKKAANPLWLTSDDHTSPGDNQRGRFMQVNAIGSPKVLYRHTLSGICPDSRLSFHAWLANASNASLHPNVVFSLVDPLTADTLARYFTGDVPGAIATDWRHWGVEYTVPNGLASIEWVIEDNGPGGRGNKLGLDDIEIRLCLPRVGIKSTATSRCEGEPVSFTGTYNETSTPNFTSPLICYWEFSEDASTWIRLGGTQRSMPGTSISNTYTITAVASKNQGYYRMLVTDATRLDKKNCSASAMVQFEVLTPPANQPDIRVQLCSSPNRTLNLSSYVDPMEFKSILWERISTRSPDFTSGTSTTLGQVATGQFIPGIHTYRYTLVNSCYTASALMYLSTLAGGPARWPGTVVICKNLPISMEVPLNQLMGLEANGTWSYDASLAPYVMEALAGSQFAGSYVFNAKAACANISDPSYRVAGGYKGDMEAKQFKFTYTTTSPKSCLGNSTHKVVIIVTSEAY